jgi:hypothetical protein
MRMTVPLRAEAAESYRAIGRAVAASLIAAAGFALASPAAAQLTRDTPMLAAEKATLDLNLRRGRVDAGERMTESQWRGTFVGRVRAPFNPLLQEAERLGLNDEQADSIASVNRRYAIASEAIWTPVVRYLATLPIDYNIDEAALRVSRAYTAVIDVLIRNVAIADAMLTDDQRAQLSANTLRLLNPTCLRAQHPYEPAGARIGGAGASGIGRVTVPGC